LHRYSGGGEDGGGFAALDHVPEAGLSTSAESSQLTTHSLKAAWFQPLSPIKRKTGFTKFVLSKFFSLCRYTEEHDEDWGYVRGDLGRTPERGGHGGGGHSGGDEYRNGRSGGGGGGGGGGGDRGEHRSGGDRRDKSSKREHRDRDRGGESRGDRDRDRAGDRGDRDRDRERSSKRSGEKKKSSRDRDVQLPGVPDRGGRDRGGAL
jgi:hypothetical protein